MLRSLDIKERRRSRVRFFLKKFNKNNYLRFSVFRSNRYIYAQLINDQESRTVISASSLEKDLRSSLKRGSDKEAASAVGRLIAERALKKGITQVIFDRGPYLFHGRVQALADAARNSGLIF